MTTETDVTNAISQVIGIPSSDLTSIPVVPPILVTLVHDYSQKFLTAISIWAITHGSGQFIDQISKISGQNSATLTASTIQIGVGAAGIALSCAWTLVVAYLRKERMTDLLNFIPNRTVT